MYQKRMLEQMERKKTREQERRIRKRYERKETLTARLESGDMNGWVEGMPMTIKTCERCEMVGHTKRNMSCPFYPE